MAEILIQPDAAVPLELHLYDEAETPLQSHPLSAGDLLDAAMELWTRQVVMPGEPHRQPEALRVSELPDGQSFTLECRDAHGVVAGTFPADSLQSVAQRFATGLQPTGAQPSEASFRYSLHLPAGGPVWVSLPARLPPRVIQYPLAPLLAAARAVDGRVDEPFPFFYVKSAFQRAEQLSRCGALLEPPVETGCALVGAIGHCSETGRCYLLVVEALAIRSAECKPHSLGFSSKSWSVLSAAMRARQGRAATAAHRLVGTAHGHPFPVHPDGGVCAACASREVCTASTVFLSLDDRRFMSAAFAGQGWQVAQVFGRTARGEPADGLFGLQGGQLTRRGYGLLEEIPPDLAGLLGFKGEPT